MSPFLFELSQSQDTYFTDSHIVRETHIVDQTGQVYLLVFICINTVLGNDFNNRTWWIPSILLFSRRYWIWNKYSFINQLASIQTHNTGNYVDYGPEESLSDVEVFNSCKEILINNNPVQGDVILQFDELDGAA